jgi:heme/copper-type cytochrome/quinol oxidase subunit 4
VKQEKKSLLTKYIICFCIAAAMTVIVFWIKGFFGNSPAVNLQIVADGFFVSGILMTMFAGMMFIAGEGALIGITFVLRNIVQAFTPMGRKNHEFYAQYRERKLSELKKSTDHCVLITGLLFIIISIIFTVIWYMNYYNPTV